jgi:hypothetical protein
MANTLARIADLKADFQRLADRAPGVRARLTVRAGRFGLFLVGRPCEDRPDEEGMVHPGASPAFAELYALTDQAGTLWAEMRRSGYSWRPALPKSIHYHVGAPWEVWLIFLLHTPPVCFSCSAMGPNGQKRLALSQLGSEKEVVVWIDDYCELCVTALTLLKTAALQGVETETAVSGGHRDSGTQTLMVPAGGAPPVAVQYVSLDNMAAIVNRSKRTLERLKSRKKNPLPAPDVEGGGGRPDEWDWSTVRAWLEKEYGRQLPKRYPSIRSPS